MSSISSTPSRALRIRVKIGVDVPEPWVHSVVGVWGSADWLERECFDMFGIDFRGHPDLRRILMYDTFVGHPLRKDYPYKKRQPIVPEIDPMVHPNALRADRRNKGLIMPLPARWSQKIEASDPSDEIMELQMGPSHPAAHGTIKFNLKLDGERIADCDVEVGFLHRAFEKMCEQGTWTQCFPYTDRLNYASPCINNVGFALAVERLLGIETTERAKYLRVIMSEISRITDHLTCLGMATRRSARLQLRST